MAVAVAVLVLAAPAHAIVGGHAIDPRRSPWLADFKCGATLVAPDRALTAAHCVAGTPVANLPALRFGTGDRRRVVRVALLPAYVEDVLAERVNPEGESWDLALLQLDRPVTGVRPLQLPAPGTRLGRRVSAIGAGRTGLARARTRLRAVELRPIADAGCAAFYRRYARRHDQAYARAFVADQMLCAVDPDGRPPYRSTCSGDSGGPLLMRTRSGLRLVGVTSWGGDRCGADADPAVFTDARAFRAFVTAPEPNWGPAAGPDPAQITGAAVAGNAVSCAATWRFPPDRILYEWFAIRAGQSAAVPIRRQRDERRTYAVQDADTGHLLMCRPIGVSASGIDPAVPAVIPVGPAAVPPG